jgi:hypothetical protein
LDGLVYLPNGSKGISAWDPIAGKLVAELAPASGDFLRIRPLRGGRHVVSSGMSSEIVVWDCETRQIVRRIELPEGERRAIALETTPDDVLYAGVSRQILRVDLGSRKSASSLVGLTSGQFTAWSRVRTVRDLNGLELKSIRAPNRPINWVGPRNGWPQQSPAWLEPPLTEEGPDHVWARDKLRRECDGVAKTIRAQTAESWLRKFEGYRFRLETQPDGQTVRVPVPRRTMDSAGRYVGEPEGHIDYAAWYRDHVGELPTVHARKPSNGGVID